MAWCLVKHSDNFIFYCYQYKWLEHLEKTPLKTELDSALSMKTEGQTDRDMEGTVLIVEAGID
jgi:hypothetical protein